MFVVKYDEWRVYWGRFGTGLGMSHPTTWVAGPTRCRGLHVATPKEKDANRLVSIRLFASDEWRLWIYRGGACRWASPAHTRESDWERQRQKPSGKARAGGNRLGASLIISELHLQAGTQKAQGSVAAVANN